MSSELGELKCDLKPVHAADFAKQALIIQELADIMELNKILAEVTNFFV